MTYLFLIGGLILLIAGAELLVRGASRLAFALGVSPLLIGLTIVALGTSSPELVVSVSTSIAGEVQISLGNIIGSNIFNVLFILGVSALVIPLMVSRRLIRIDVPVMIIVSLMVLLMGLDGSLNLVDGIILLGGSILYVVYSISLSKKETAKPNDEFIEEYGGDKVRERMKWLKYSIFIVAGLGMLVLGSRWFVDAAIMVARQLGVSDLIIGLTIVAAGTSLPELATSIIASLKGERDIAVGNVVGSNILNILVILGLSAVVAPDGLTVARPLIRFDLPVMTAIAFACLPVFFTNSKISRWEGGLFLVYYVLYVLYLIMAATHHDLLSRFSWVMGGFVVPLTLITLILVALWSYRKKRRVKSRDLRFKFK